MNRFRVIAMGMMLTAGMAVGAQTSPASNESSSQPAQHHGVPTAAEQLKLLSERLELTSDQQAKIMPMLQALHDATVKLVRDQSMSHEEMIHQVHTLRIKADGQIREVLTEEQKMKLDQVEHEPHPELHGDVGK